MLPGYSNFFKIDDTWIESSRSTLPSKSIAEEDEEEEMDNTIAPQGSESYPMKSFRSSKRLSTHPVTLILT